MLAVSSLQLPLLPVHDFTKSAPDATPYTEARIDAMASINYIDSPSTTSSTVYSIDFRNITDYSGCNINGAWSGGTGTSHPVSTIHALEIDGT